MRLLVLLTAATALSGCGAPPSVHKLMEVVDQTLARERRLVAADAVRAATWAEQRRRSLRAAFHADLEQREDLTVQWVREGVAAYVAAREAVLKHNLELMDQYRIRRENLELARRAQQRAMRLLRQHDQLWQFLPDPRQWLADENE